MLVVLMLFLMISVLGHQIMMMRCWLMLVYLGSDLLMMIVVALVRLVGLPKG